MQLQFAAQNLKKAYIRKTIFSGISFTLVEGGSLTVTGRNGSGKSTLLKALAQLHGISSGSLSLSLNGVTVSAGEMFRHIGFVSPYLQVYEEFTAWENLSMIRNVRGLSADDDLLRSLLETVQLYPRRNDTAKTFSSGMKQRLKYACALLHAPHVLLLDEPTANLDTVGRAMVEAIAERQQRDGILVVATNEPQEISWCKQRIDLDERNAR